MLGKKPTGALAPYSTAAAFALCEQPIPEESRLHELEARDLVGEGNYARWDLEMQGDRNTCVAFAVTACIELLRAVDRQQKFDPDKVARLSPQFLYWWMRQTGYGAGPPPGWEEGATRLGQAEEVLKGKGICEWSLCPYAQLAPDQRLEGPRPSDDAERAAARLATDSVYHNWPDPNDRPAGIAKLVYDRLAEDRPVAVAVPLFYLDAARSTTNWDSPTTTASGKILDPQQDAVVPIDDHLPGHAVCVVAFQPDPQEPTGGWFIFRNSRGLNWAAHRNFNKSGPPTIPAAGYGAVSASYIERFAWEMLSPNY